MSALQALLNDPPGAAGVWQLVPTRSSVRFKNKTFWGGLATVTGTFGDVSGTGQVGSNGAVSGGRLEIGASSLKTGIGKKRDEHLRSADFFDVENHPRSASRSPGWNPPARTRPISPPRSPSGGSQHAAAAVGHDDPPAR